MKVLIVHPDKGIYGGAEEVVNRLVNYLSKTGNEVRLIYGAGAFNLWKDTQTWSNGVDVINAHNFPATLAAFPIKNIPIVWMCNEPAELFTNWWRKPIEAFNRWWVRNSDMKVVVATEYDKNRFKRIYGVEPKVIPYGIDYEFWSQGKRSQRHGSIRILQVGTITPYKNQIASVQTLVALVSMGMDATLTLAGSFGVDIEYYKRLDTYIECDASPDLWKKVNFLGQVNKEEVRKLYYDHDILLHPVRQQGGWLVPFEAACTGIKVIVSKEFQVSCFFGCHIEDLESVVEYIKTPMEYIPEHQPSPEHIRDNLTWDKFGESMLKVFEEAVNE